MTAAWPLLLLAVVAIAVCVYFVWDGLHRWRAKPPLYEHDTPIGMPKRGR